MTSYYLESHSYFDFPEDETINILLERQAALSPDSLAVIYRGNKFTFCQINETANRLSNFLLDKIDIQKGDIALICLEKSEAMLLSTLAVFKCQAIYAPVEPKWSIARIDMFLKDVSPQFVITSSHLGALFLGYKNVFYIDDILNKLSSFPKENLNLRQSGSDLAYLVYSSGTTGKPKGILGTHRTIISRFAWSWHDFPFKDDDICAFIPAFATIESLWAMFGSLCKKIPLVIPTDDEIKNVECLMDLLQSQGITRIELIPSTIKLLLSRFPDLLKKLPLLSMWDISGEIFDRDMALKFFSSGNSESNIRLVNRMGASEASSFLFYELFASDLIRNSIPVGRPTTNTTIFILDENLKPVEKGMSGELFVTGPCVARGYLNDPNLTAEKFLDNPFKTPYPYSEKLYRTGDIVRENEEGLVEYIGRQDFQIKIRGFRVNLAEIEETLKTHPRVQDAVVMVFREEDIKLVAFVVLDENKHSLSEEALSLRNFLIKRLPLNSIPPEFIFLEKIPLMSSGKIDRNSLKSNFGLNNRS